MRVKHRLKHFGGRALARLAFMAVAYPLAGQATTANVSIGDFFFSPTSSKINVNDQVIWTWTGNISHSTTSNGGLWDSGLHGNGFTFSRTFTTAGNFPYRCSLHASMTGSITVQSANVPPSVALTSPSNGASFSAPAMVTIQAAASDSDGSVTNVQFFDGATTLGHASSNPYSITANLAPGSHTLTAVASDNLGATTASSDVVIKVLTPVPIGLSSPKRVSASAFQFDYNADPGLSYVVLRSTDFLDFTPISTNTATTNQVNFLDNSATGTVNFYRVRLLPNP
jgi:plastocyanin